MKTTILKSVTTVLVALFSLNAFAYDVEIDGIYYNLISKVKTAKVTNPYDNMIDKALNNVYSGILTIPETIEHNGIQYTVTEIEAYAFQFNGVASISLPNTITSIGMGAFESSSIKSIVFPNSVTSIGMRAFANCSGLETVTLPNSLHTIGDDAFSGCRKLKEVSISNTIISIGNRAFSGCVNLKTIDIPKSVSHIGRSAFYGCSKLEQVVFHDATLISIGYGAFDGCEQLSSINLPNSVSYIEGESFSGCTSLTSIEIPTSVGSIERGTFSGCSHLEHVTLPSSITSIGSGAFADCPNLSEIYCYASEPPTIPESDKFLVIYKHPFDKSFPDYITLHVPSASIDAYKATEPWSGLGTIVALTEEETGLESIISKIPVSTIFTLDGRQVPNLQKGVNIIKMSDGNTKKVLLK